MVTNFSASVGTAMRPNLVPKRSSSLTRPAVRTCSINSRTAQEDSCIGQLLTHLAKGNGRLFLFTTLARLDAAVLPIRAIAGKGPRDVTGTVALLQADQVVPQPCHLIFLQLAPLDLQLQQLQPPAEGEPADGERAGHSSSSSANCGAGTSANVASSLCHSACRLPARSRNAAIFSRDPGVAAVGSGVVPGPLKSSPWRCQGRPAVVQ